VANLAKISAAKRLTRTARRVCNPSANVFRLRETRICPAPIGHARCGASIVPDLLTLETLADVLTPVEEHLPAELGSKFSWRYLPGLLKRSAVDDQI
jgi:hypothetical protein